MTALMLLAPGSARAQAQWVHFATNGTLAYYADNMTNRIPDFSFAGYQGGGVPLPYVPVKQTITPVGGDNTASIQSAINTVSALSPDSSGFRGAVLLKAGTYPIAGTLKVSASGVVLRGEGNNTNTGTVLVVTGLARNVITLTGSGSWSQVGSSYTITDSYVPLGATSFHLSSASSFALGNSIVVQRPQTQPWIDALGMNVTNINWKPGGGLYFERKITAISGNQITIDAPLCNPIEQAWTTGTVYQVTDPSRIQFVGIENLCGVGQISDYPSNILTGAFAVYSNLKNSWMHDVLMSGWGNGVSLNSGCKWCTVQDCQYAYPATGTASAAPAAYTIGDSDQMNLMHRCTSDGGYYHIMVTQAGTAGPNVFLNFASSGTHYNGGPHQRWAAGALHDNILMAADSQGGYTPYLAINNRGTAGSGQGWAAGFSIMYNCRVPQFQLEQPAITNHYNWIIGGIGSAKSYSDPGIYDALGTLVSPRSLYLEQLKERLGGVAVENIGYPLFTLTTTPSSQVVTAGNGVGYTVTAGDTNGFNSTIALTVTGLPTGATASFNPAVITGSGNSTLTVSTTGSTPGGSYTLTVVGASGGVSHTNLATLQVGGFSTLVWAASNSSAWDLNNSYNWLNPALGQLSQFTQGDAALFDDTAGVTNTITLADGVAVMPAAITNNSSVNNFAISGAGRISGATGILKEGTSTLTLSTSNDFTGTVTVMGGILKVGNVNALGTGSSGVVVVTNSGTLDVNGLNLSAEPVTVSGAGLTNGGAVINTGPSQTTALKLVTLAGDATFGGTSRWDIRGSGASLMTGGQPWKITKTGTNQVSLVAVGPIDAALGDIDIQQGMFAIQTTTAQVGDPNRTITVRGNATLELWTLTASPLNKKLVLNDGATVFNEKAPSTVTGPVTLQGSNTFNAANYGAPPTLTFSDALTGTGLLNKIGAGTLALAGTNTYTGSTLVTAGTLALTGSGSIASSASINLSPGAILDSTGRTDGTLALAPGQILMGGGTVTGNLLVVGPGATVSPGAAAGLIGTLTVASALTLQGTAFMKLSKSGAPANDLLQAGTTITYGGTLSLTNLAGTLQVGDSFKLFSAATYAGLFANIVPPVPGSGLAWNVAGLTNGVLKIVAAPPVFGGSSILGANLVLVASNGVPGGNCYVLSSTNIASPLVNWTSVATNAFDASGSLRFTNGAALPQQFYRLQLP